MEYKLSELFDLQMGKTPSRNNHIYWNTGDNKWISIGDLSESNIYITETKEHISDLAVRESGIKAIPENTVVMSFKLSIGKTAITTQEMYSNEAIMAFIDKKTITVLPEYLYYLLSGQDWNKGTNNAVMGKTLNKATLSERKIYIRSLEEQKKIVDILNGIKQIIDKYKSQLNKLDTLIKARFVEMFGDATNNNKDWETASVESVCQEILGGGTSSKAHPEYYEGGDIPWVSSKDMKADVLYDSQIRINKLGVENSAARMVPVNSVIMVIRSGILKHSLPVAINAVPLTVNQDLKVFVPGDRIITRFMATQFKMQEKKILAGVRAVTADNIEFNSLKQRLLIIPPIELQNEFVSFAEQVDKSKVIAIFFLKSKQNIHIEMQKI